LFTGPGTRYARLAVVSVGAVGGWPGPDPRFLARTASITAAYAYATAIVAKKAMPKVRPGQQHRGLNAKWST